ncbi:hypothetical protein VN12_17905 [Pirellula sp. SH-Sr6A]|nr:hypothetical protein VN12_17905 [Pirellula sp. SH-Sr6A]
MPAIAGRAILRRDAQGLEWNGRDDVQPLNDATKPKSRIDSRKVGCLRVKVFLFGMGAGSFSPRRYDATGRGWESNRSRRGKPGSADSRHESRWFRHADGKALQSILSASFAPLRETSSSPPDSRPPKRWVPAIVNPRVSRQGATTQREEVGNRIEVEGESRDPRTLATKRGGSDMPKGRHSSQSSLRA